MTSTIFMLSSAFYLLLSATNGPEVKEKTYSVYFTDTSPQKMKMKKGDPFYYLSEKYRVLDIKEDGEIILIKWKEE